tara:strand:+ start:98 stop:664 length:567 start_codon:yes stop_codon:yes gene_type:complete
MSSTSLYHQSDTRIQTELQIIEKSKINPQHFAPLYDQYYESIFRYVIKRINDSDLACDITSNVFVKAITNLPKYEFRGLPFSSWLFRIAKSEVYQSFRDQKVKRTVSLDKVTIVQVFEELEVDGLEEHKEKLKIALRKINDKDLALIEMRYFEKRSYREIGQILNVTENNAKVKSFRALQKLKVLFKE